MTQKEINDPYYWSFAFFNGMRLRYAPTPWLKFNMWLVVLFGKRIEGSDGNRKFIGRRYRGKTYIVEFEDINHDNTN